MKNETLYGIEDGLFMNQQGVGSWSADKYALVRLYAHLFTSGMKGKWPNLVYVDMYSGAGQSRIDGSGDILLGSPLIALSIDIPFDRYIFCDMNSSALEALQARVSSRFPNANATYLLGDCNTMWPQVLSLIPSGALCLCFVDPYDLGIHFDTLQRLSANRNIDFLCLLASRTDAGRNRANYIADDSDKVDLFLGSRDWRLEQNEPAVLKQNFGDYLCSKFAARMETLGYLPSPTHEMRTIKDSNRALYRLALFARHITAKNYWTQVLKYSIPQRSLFD
jgi:three-Cys-motif partner protein